MLPSTRSSIGSVRDLRTGGRWFDSSARQILFPRIDDSHYDRMHSSLTAAHCFDDDYVGMQPVAWKEYCAEYRSKEFQKGMGRCTSPCDIIEITLKTALITIQSISHLLCEASV